MKILKKIKLDMWINTIMMVLIGVLFLMNAHDSLKVISIIAGILIVCSGIFDLIYDSKLRRNTYFTYGTLFEGILKCILGIFIATCKFRKNCASVPEERSAIPLQTEQSSTG